MYLGNISVSNVLTAFESRMDLILNILARLDRVLTHCVLANVSVSEKCLDSITWRLE